MAEPGEEEARKIKVRPNQRKKHQRNPRENEGGKETVDRPLELRLFDLAARRETQHLATLLLQATIHRLMDARDEQGEAADEKDDLPPGRPQCVRAELQLHLGVVVVESIPEIPHRHRPQHRQTGNAVAAVALFPEPNSRPDRQHDGDPERNGELGEGGHAVGGGR